MSKKAIRYQLIAFGWTWACWLGAYFWGKSIVYSVVTDATLWDLFRPAPDLSRWAIQALFAAGVFGPLLGYLLVAPKRRRAFLGCADASHAALAVIFPVVCILPGFFLSLLFDRTNAADVPFARAAMAIALYFLSNVLTSGTEEFGWRGFLYPEMKERESSFWSITWKSGLIWAVWHYPLMMILYWHMGVAVALPTLVGFTAGIVAMAYLSNYVYEQTQSIALLMVMHALNNTVSFALMLLFPKTPFTILSSLTAWAIVIWLEKKAERKKAA